MQSVDVKGVGSRLGRWAAALLLVIGLAATTVASAASSATIMVFAPGAPPGTMATVQWLDPTSSTWQTVSGWTATLSQQTASGVPFQSWAVLPANYGQGPFRWVVYNNNLPANVGNQNMANMNTAGSTLVIGQIWGVSSQFMLPVTDGVNLEITVVPEAALNAISTTVVNHTPAATPTPGATAACTGNNCTSEIVATFSGLPATSWITVEWQDGFGNWQPVMGWQGMADTVDTAGTLTKQFGVYQRNYGQGPFRWAVYNSALGGTLLAVSPSFNLPTTNGQVMTMDLSA